MVDHLNQLASDMAMRDSYIRRQSNWTVGTRPMKVTNHS